MDTELVTLQVPATLYHQLQTLASETHTSPIAVMEQLVMAAQQQRRWQQDVKTLRQLIQRSGCLSNLSSQESMIEKLRQTRQEIFAAEYAHHRSYLD